MWPCTSPPQNLDEAEELLEWWHEVMTVPIVALTDAPEAMERLRQYTDFVSPQL